MGEPYFVRIPATVYYRTKSTSQETIGWATEATWAANKAYVEGAPFGPWYLGAGGVACGTQVSVSSFILHVDSFAAAAAVQFKVEWPEIPEGALGIYTIREGGYGYIRDHNSLWPTIEWPTFDPTGSVNNGWVDSSSQTICIEAFVEYYVPAEPPCDEMEATDISFDGATLHGAAATHWQWGEIGDNVGQESETGILTGLQPDTEYWYKALSYCETKIFKFKTEKEDEDEEWWNGVIITLPVTEVWASSLSQGATIHGMLKFPPRANTKTWYLAIGFQLGLSVTETTNIMWNRTGYFTAYAGTRPTIYPIQLTSGGLLPDLTYYYRACLHQGSPPMNVNNNFGSTLSFGGPVSLFGFGREYVTAKKAEDDISRLAAGRYYMDKQGVFQYESYQRRKTA